MIEVTDHAMKRLKERLGLPKKACQRHVERAFEEGIKHSEVTGRVKKYFDKLFFEHKASKNMRIYGTILYIFRNKTLIIVIPLPRNIIALLKTNVKF